MVHFFGDDILTTYQLYACSFITSCDDCAVFRHVCVIESLSTLDLQVMLLLNLCHRRRQRWHAKRG